GRLPELCPARYTPALLRLHRRAITRSSPESRHSLAMLSTATPERITGKRRRARQPQGWRLGRNRQVIRQTWRVDEDPRTARPIEATLASGWTAADAADLAREVAEFFVEHGYDKSSGCWWA